MKRTFVDAGVLIAAVRGQEELARRALKVLSDPEREFIGGYPKYASIASSSRRSVTGHLMLRALLLRPSLSELNWAFLPWMPYTWQLRPILDVRS